MDASEEPKPKARKIEATSRESEEEAEEDIVDERALLREEEEDDDDEERAPQDYPTGIPDTFSIVHHATIPPQGFPLPRMLASAVAPEEVRRLKLQPDDVPVHVAAMLLFPEHFASVTKARKETRRKKVLVHRGPLLAREEGAPGETFDRERLALGKVGDRV